MKVEKSVKEFGKKVFISVLVALTLFSTSTLTAVLTQQKAVEAAILQKPLLTNEQTITSSNTISAGVTIVQIEAGLSHSLALMSDGTVWAWGANNYGQLGNGSTAASVPPVQVSNLSDVIAVSAGTSHSMAVKSDGTVWAWGLNTNGRLGDGTTTQRTAPVQVMNLTGVVSIAAGADHSMAVKSDGTVWAWGLNTYGRLGDGTTTQRTSPVLVSNLTGVVSIAAGAYHSMAFKSDGTVWAWGLNTNGRLGDGTTTQRITPVQVKNFTGAVSIAAGEAHSIALKSDGTVWAWGLNTNGRLGDGTTTQRTTPVQVSNLTGIIAVSAGSAHSMALQSDGTVWAWGLNTNGQLGDGTATIRTTAVQVSSLTGAVSIAAGGSHSIALKSDGKTWAWGNNANYQLGDWSILNRNTPVQVIGIAEIIDVSVGSSHYLALKSDGTVWAWGLNTNGRLGDGTTTTRYTPVQVSGLSGVIAVSAGDAHSMALKSDGTVWAWGLNTNGRLGDGTTTQRTTPVQVSNLTGIIAISAGSAHSMALKSDGTVWAWGLNTNGRLGDGTTTARATPVQTKNLTSITAISAGASHSMALKSDGTVWAWGLNTNGQLGDSTTTQRTSPVMVSNLTGVVSIAAGSAHSLAVKSDGTVWAWGLNTNGRLGDGTITQRTSPVQVSNLTGVSSISAGNAHSLAIKLDGTAWAWGLNTNGQLGDGTITQRLTPVQVSGFTNAILISAGVSSSLAVKQNGMAWIWGYVNTDRITSSSVPVRSHVGIILPESLIIEQDSYVAVVPENSGSYAEIIVNAVALDSLDNPISDIEITYSLAQPYTGISVDSLTGVVTVDNNALPGSAWIKAFCEGLSSIVELELIVPSALSFNQNPYAAVIPASGNPSATVTIKATAFDALSNPLDEVACIYSLDGIYSGVSIDSASGVITIDDTASFGIIEITASCYGLIASSLLNLISATSADNGEIIIPVEENEYYTVSSWAYDVEDFEGLYYVLTYDAFMLVVEDLSALTWNNELTLGEIPGTGITIIAFNPGEIIFTFNTAIAPDMAWNGITNVFLFKAIDSGFTTVNLFEASAGYTSRTTTPSKSDEKPALTSERTLPKQEETLSGRTLPYDERAKGLMARLSEYNDFSDDDKQYIREYLGLIRPPTEEELYFIAQWEKEQAELINNISPEAILLGLLEERTTFDTISPQDWAKIEKFFSNLTTAEIEALLKRGASAKEILRINLTMEKGLFDVFEAEKLLKMYPDDSERSKLVFNFYTSTLGSDETVKQSAKTMVLNGASIDTVRSTLNLASGVTRILLNPETDEIRIYNPNGSTPSRGGLSAQEFDPVAPFSVNNGTGESIDLNSGNLRYIQDILNLTGINGFDLNLALVYNSAESALYTEIGEEYWYELWIVLCQEDLYINGDPYDAYCYAECFYDYYDALSFANDYSSGVQISSSSGWISNSIPDTPTGSWINEMLIARAAFNYWYEDYIVYDNPAPSKLYVSYNDGYKRYSGYILPISESLTYDYCDGEYYAYSWDWCYHCYETWTTDYEGELYGELFFEYKVILTSESPPYLEDEGYYRRNIISHKVEGNGLGAGWSWNLPSINDDGNNSTLNLGNGQSYTIGEYNSSTNTYALKNYSLQDLVLKQDNSYNNGQYTSYYVLEYKNGDKAYFNNKGLLMAQVDRYENTITYKYSSFGGNQVLSQIIDSAGRTINLAYANTSNGRTVTITLPDNSQILITMDKISGHMTHYALTAITDAKGNQTQFNYTTSAGAFNLFENYNVSSSNNYWALLTEVIYPTSAKKAFSYTKYTDNVGSYGYRQFYRVTARKDIVDWTDYNLKTYSYSGSSNGNGAYDPNDLPSGYTYSATITDGNDPQNILTTIYVFNNKHLSISETVKNNNVMVSTTTYDYNADKLPVTLTLRIYNSSGDYMEAILLYEYDSKGNVTAYWNEQANGNKANTDFKTTLTYDSAYSLLLTKTYKQDANTTILEQYTLTPDNKSISAVEIKVNNVLQAKTAFTYSAKGEVLTEQAYKDGFVNYVETTYTYDSAGNLTDIINSGIKDVDGNLVTGTPGANSAAGRLAQSFSYNSVGWLTSATDANGNTTSYQYDVLGRVTKITNPDNTFQTMSYDDVNNILTVTDELGVQLKYYYDSYGNLLRIYDVTEGQYLLINTYDAKMRLSTSGNHNNSAQSALTSYTYDYFDRVLTQVTTDKNNTIIASESYVYDNASDSGLYLKTTHTIEGDSNSPSIVSSTYVNKSGLLEKQSRTFNNTEYFDFFSYDYLGNLLTEKTAIAVQNYNYVPYTAKYEYDFAGRVIKQYNVASEYSTFEYDALGRLISSTDYAANASLSPYSTTYIYDDLGRLLQQSIPFEKSGGTTYYSVTKYYYDANGNVTKQQTSDNLPAQANSYTKTEYQYNSRNLLTQATQYDGVTAYYTSYTYFANGLVATMVSGNGASTTSYTYDHAGRVLSVTDALSQTETYSYDTNGNLTSKTDRNGWVTTYTYDGLGRVLTMTVDTASPSTDISQAFTYTLTGALLSEDNGDFAAIYTYDELGRLVSVSESNNVIKTYTYDIADNRLSYVLKADNVIQINTGYVYDHFNRLEIVEENGLTVAVYTYDINGNRDSLIYANGTSEYYTYNLANMVTSLINKEGSTVISSFSYTYYLDGNQHTKTDHTGLVTTYEYDGMGRLVLEEETLLSIVQQSWTYTYDTSHNRIMMVTYSPLMTFVTDYTYDLNNRLLTEARATGNGWAITNYSYDNNGNQIVKYYQELQYIPLGGISHSIGLSAGQEGFDTYTYDGLNRLIAVNIGEVEATYSYKADGLRISKTVDNSTTKHIWDGSYICLELDGNDAVIAKYIHGLNLIAAESNGFRLYYLYNAHSDITQTADSYGAVVNNYAYDAFGNELNPDPNDSNPFRYCGEYYDIETGNYYLRARYLDPSIGRFISADTHWNVGNMIYGNNPVKWNEREANERDPLGLNTYTYRPDIQAIMQSGNLYAYCMANPVMFVDPSGNIAIIDDIAVGLVVVGIVAIAGVCVYLMTPAGQSASRSLGTTIADSFSNAFKWVTGLFAANIPKGLTNVAKDYGILRCVEATDAMVKYLQNNNKNGGIVTIQFSGGIRDNYVISSMNPTIAISSNGRHMGVLFQGKIYCNIHPYGLPTEQWISDFLGVGEKSVSIVYF